MLHPFVNGKTADTEHHGHNRQPQIDLLAENLHSLQNIPNSRHMAPG